MLIGWTETVILIGAAALFVCGLTRLLRLYRSLLWGTSVLMLITALFPRQGNPLGIPRLPIELFGVAWWILGAWLVNGVLNLILRRTLFPVDNEPHARRLFADLASVLVYLVALVGIVDTVLKQPISTVLATSGVLAIILGLALQNTLSDVFSGLAINIERPFGAGDWITVTNDVEGQVRAATAVFRCRCCGCADAGDRSAAVGRGRQRRNCGPQHTDSLCPWIRRCAGRV